MLSISSNISSQISIITQKQSSVSFAEENDPRVSANQKLEEGQQYKKKRDLDGALQIYSEVISSLRNEIEADSSLATVLAKALILRGNIFAKKKDFVSMASDFAEADRFDSDSYRYIGK